MTKPCSDTAEVLIVRPWFGMPDWGNGYAHFDALVMSRVPGQAHQRYADYRVLDRYDPDLQRTPSSITSVSSARSTTAIPKPTPGSGATNPSAAASSTSRT